MPEQKDKSLDDQLKEAELAIKTAELEKLKEETALVRKQLTAKWYSGKSLAQITALVLTVVAVYTAIDKIFLAELKQKEARLAKVEAGLFQSQVDSLNREKKEIITTIDGLKIRATISAAFGDLDSLEYANVLKQYKTIKTNNYYDKRLNPDGAGVENDFEVDVVEGDTVIHDDLTRLTWQGGGKFPKMGWLDAKNYVSSLSYAGFDDWRLPTLKEAMSLMEPEKVVYDASEGDSLYIDARFKDTPSFWTGEKHTVTSAWFVNFLNGGCYYDAIDYVGYHVRAVR